jgi:hypothetical protein
LIRSGSAQRRKGPALENMRATAYSRSGTVQSTLTTIGLPTTIGCPFGEDRGRANAASRR